MSAAKECKYGCGTLILWDNATSSFKEQDGTPHTKERCESLKVANSKTDTMSDPTPKPNNGGDYSKMHEENMVANRLLVAAINRLASAIEGKKA